MMGCPWSTIVLVNRPPSNASANTAPSAFGAGAALFEARDFAGAVERLKVRCHAGEHVGNALFAPLEPLPAITQER